MKECKVKINEDEHEKLPFPCFCEITQKEETLELVTLFFRHVKDCKIFIARLSPASGETEVQKIARSKTEKKVHRLFKGCLFNNVVDKWEAAVDACSENECKMSKFQEIVHHF